MQEALIFFYVFFFGAVWGSFLNMAIYRVKHEKKFGGRSFCDHTKEPLGALDLIPIFSYIIFRGKCRKCDKKIPLLYPLIEITTGLLFVLTLYFLSKSDLPTLGIAINSIIVWVYALFFVFFAGYDFLYWQVNVRSIQIALIFGILMAVASFFFAIRIFSGLNSLLGGLVAGGIIWLIYRITTGSGMGEGDIYLMAFAGFFVGLSGVLPLILFSSVLGSIVGIVKSYKLGTMKGVKIQFAPFISIGALMTFFLSDFLLNYLYIDYQYFFSLLT